MPARNQGYSLYELLLTLAIAATVLSLGLPSFAGSLARSRQSVEINALFHAIHVARKESIMRRRVVTVCPSRDGASCGTVDDWSSGWIMFENTNRDSPPSVDREEPVLQVHRVNDNVHIVANRRSFTLRSTFLRATNGTLIVCDAAARIPGKALVVSYTGRPRVAPRQTDGKPWACPN